MKHYQDSIKWKFTTIPVCWEKSAENFSKEKDWVRAAVSRSWESNSNIRFDRWCPCSVRMPGIHIGIRDSEEGVYVKKLGANLDGLIDGMLLNFTLRNWGGDIRTKMRSRQNAIEALAVHEFGHALGFTHQHIRNKCMLCHGDNEYFFEALKDIEKFEEKEGLWLTDCDQHSVMNYCNAEYANGGILSKQDSIAVSLIYGRSPSSGHERRLHLQTYIQPIDSIKLFKNEAGLQIQEGSAYYELERYRYHKVKVMILGDSNVTSKISSVTYYLDRTFPVNVYQNKDAKNNFLFQFATWGKFTVKAKVFFSDSREPEEIEIELPLPPFKVKRRSPWNFLGWGAKQTSKGSARQVFKE